MPKLAINGGEPYRKKPFQDWPIPNERAEALLVQAYREKKWSFYGAQPPIELDFAKQFAQIHTAKYGWCVTNGSDTLKIALRAVGVMPDDEVIVPALTWVATATAPLRVGAVTVFADVTPDTYCIDPDDVKSKITPRTKAIIPVHLYSCMADMDAIMSIADEHQLWVVEDCAHTHGSLWRGRGAGSIGHFGSFSFQQSKVLASGEGGMLITNDFDLLKRAFSLLNCGRPYESEMTEDASRHDEAALAGEESLVGDNNRIGGFQAAVLLGHLPDMIPQVEKKQANMRYLDERLAKIPNCKPMFRDSRVDRQSMYEYTFRYTGAQVPGAKVRAAISAEGIPLSDPYTPIYRSRLWQPTAREFPQLLNVDYSTVSCPVAEWASAHESINILHQILLGDRQDMDDIVGAVEKVMTNLDEIS
jgi:L-glutamine:2-deoxy-scyllo-inosose/3-amino-2,3-dideoxy-scyllo-inosose aminotransferase